MTKRVITFAGVPGSSKTPIANHLSWNVGFPIFNNDAIRTEVKEDLGHFDQDEYLRRRNVRLDQIFEMSDSLMYDASVDRAWPEFSKRLDEAHCDVFIISMDLSRALLATLYQAKGYEELPLLDGRLAEHEAFLREYGDRVNLHITDADFSDRLEIALASVGRWLKGDNS